MTELKQTAPDNLALRAENSIEIDRGERESTALAYLTVIVVLALCAGMVWIEFENISLALRQLFPTYRDGSSDLDGTRTLAFASIGAIACGEVLLRMASHQWTERTRYRVNLIGLAALALFAVSVMFLIPSSIWQANNSSQDGGGAVSQNTYLAFSTMLAALFPLALFANFALISQLEGALGKIVRSARIDGRISRKRRLLADREKTRAQLSHAEQQQVHAPSDAQLAEQHAARSAAVIGEVVGQLHRTIMARDAGNGSADAPLVASDVPLFNHLPVERLQDQRDYLLQFTPETIRQRILEQGQVS